MHSVRRAHHHGGPDHVRPPGRHDAAAEEAVAADVGGGNARSRPDVQGGGPRGISVRRQRNFLRADGGFGEVGASAHSGVSGVGPGGAGVGRSESQEDTQAVFDLPQSVVQYLAAQALESSLGDRSNVPTLDEAGGDEDEGGPGAGLFVAYRGVEVEILNVATRGLRHGHSSASPSASVCSVRLNPGRP
ncbi:hypothetical protein SBA6_590006 [Candidatus Sulfopaludibacter sp. SbA6]|nr:hypothetical protein SBA6_590006 [Candidatus Sulfopaludibacter sp. SbA6]